MARLYRDPEGQVRRFATPDGQARLVTTKHYLVHIRSSHVDGLQEADTDASLEVIADFLEDACRAVIAVVERGRASWAGEHPESPQPPSWAYIVDLPRLAHSVVRPSSRMARQFRTRDLGVLIVAPPGDSHVGPDGAIRPDDRVLKSFYPADPPLRRYIGGVERLPERKKPHHPGLLDLQCDLEWPEPAPQILVDRLTVPDSLTRQPAF